MPAQHPQFLRVTRKIGRAVAVSGICSTTISPAFFNANWRADLAAKLLALQNRNASWNSRNARRMEKDPNLVTSYSLLALAYTIEQL